MAGLTENMRGALLMMAAMTFFTVNDAFMKALGTSMGVWQALFLRGVGVTLVMLVLARGRGELTLAMSRRDLALTLGRAAAEAGGALLFVTALFHMPIGNLSAILQALPLTVTLAGVLFLGERLGWRRSLAILAGLAGVLMIVRPGTDGFTAWSLLGVATVICVTARDIFSRMLSPAVPSLTVATVSALVVTAVAGAGLPLAGWSPVGWRESGLLIGAIVAIFIGYVGSVAAMRVGELGFVAPFRYMSLVIAILVGLAVFRETPDALTLAGAGIVVASGGYAFWRERRLARAAAGRRRE